jgi:hypothetical protein
MSPTSRTIIPSIEFCITGHLMPTEKYNQLIHNYGSTILERAPQLLDWYSVNELEIWINNNKSMIEARLTIEQIAELYSILYPLPLAAMMQ